MEVETFIVWTGLTIVYFFITFTCRGKDEERN